MSFGGGKEADSTIPAFKKFVSEDELEEKRQKRQEEWEKVRKPDEPLEAPEEEYDGRCLYDKLQEQKLKKEDELKEKHRLSNQVQGLDDGEADFLDFVSQKKEEIERQRQDQELEVLQEYRNAMNNQVTDLTSTSSSVKPKTGTSGASAVPSSSQAPKRSQQTLLAGAVKRKSQDGVHSTAEKKLKSDAADSSTESSAAQPEGQGHPESTQSVTSSSTQPQVAQVIGILPGLGAYGDSSDSDNSSSSDSDAEIGEAYVKKVVYHANHS